MLPRLYPIIDPALLAGAGDQATRVAAFARELVKGGATLIQYRNKTDSGRQMLTDARELRRALGAEVRLIMNDRADLCLAAGFDGVHVGQEDLSPEGARAVVGGRLWVGVSTHSVEQVMQADQTSADYIAIGPVFATASKENPDPVVGLEGVRAARAATRKPLVTIGGITRVNCASVIQAGADSVAVISDLLHDPAKSVEAFLRVLG
ncbi:MAG TPA: thiamine phosphate synthase [Terriglobales bacterium]|nr:thiamine phosphate synthase [Terriglobales bacterium]